MYQLLHIMTLPCQKRNQFPVTAALQNDQLTLYEYTLNYTFHPFVPLSLGNHTSPAYLAEQWILNLIRYL